MKKILSLVLTCALLFSLTACASSSVNTTASTENTTVSSGNSTAESTNTTAKPAQKDPVNLIFYQFQPGIVDQMEEICNIFNEQHPDIQVETSRPGDDYFNILKTMFASNQGPDIYSINAWTMVTDYANAGLALDLSGEAFV